MRKTTKKRTRKTRHLVVQHLEKIKGKALEDYQSTIRSFVKGKNGIYALYSGNNLYYVGLASNLRRRLRRHLRDRHAGAWDTFSVYLTRNDKHIKELEALVLRIGKPKGNRQKGKLPGSENLKRSFNNKLKQMFEDERRKIIGSEPTRAQRTRRTVARGGKKHASGTPALAPFVNKRFTIKAKYGNKTYKARVRKNGKIYYNGKLYNSPSYAGKAVVKWRTCNGWTFWRYRNSKGEWVKLKQIRK